MNKLIYGAVGLIVVLILVFNSLYIINEGEYKVVLKFGESVRTEETPGLKYKLPFIESTVTLPKYQKLYDSPPSEILTLDKKPIIVDNYTVWRIVDPEAFYKALVTISSGEDKLGTTVYNTIRAKISETNYGDVISEDTARGNLNESITQLVAKQMEGQGYGIKVIDVRIKRTDLPEENKQSVYGRMVSDRQSIAALYLSEGDEQSRRITSLADRTANVIIATAESESNKIIAEGEQQAAQIYNNAYGKSPEFYKLYRTLDSYLTSFQGEPVIMLPIDSPYTSILLGR